MAPAAPSASTEHIRELHVRINGLSDKFASHDSRNAERFASLETKANHIEKTVDKQGEKIGSIETTVNRMERKLDRALDTKSDTGTVALLRAEVEEARHRKRFAWKVETVKKAAVAGAILVATAVASIFGYKAATDSGKTGDSNAATDSASK